MTDDSLQPDSQFERELTDAERLIELVGCAALTRAISQVPSHLWGLSPQEAEDLVKPTRVAKRLRLAFIGTMRKVMAGDKKITLRDLSNEAECTYSAAHQLLNNPSMLIWIMRPIGDPGIESFVVYQSALSRMDEVLRLPFKDENGRLDYKLAELVIDIYRYVSAHIDPPISRRPTPHDPDVSHKFELNADEENL